MDIKGFKSRDGSKHQYDYNALANKPDVVSGKDGGYYTPAVTQLDEKTVQFDFTPSKEGMPAVESVTVELPVGEDSGENTGYATETWVQEGFQPKGEYLTEAPVDSINGKTGAVNLTAADVKARPDTWTPTAQEVGALPSTYTPPDQTAEQVGADPKGTAATAVSGHNTATDSHGDIRQELAAINARLTAFFDSDNQTLDELSEIVSYITSNKSLIDAITTSKVSVADIVNNLTTNVANKPLSAAQGVAIKALIDGLSTGKLDASALQSAINTALAQAKASGEFDGKDGQRGLSLLSVTTAPSSYTTAVGGITPEYRMALSTIKTQAGVSEVLLGDTVRYSYYQYPVAYLDTSYAYFTTRVSLRGTAGTTPVKGTDYFTEADKAEMVKDVLAAYSADISWLDGYNIPKLYLTGDTTGMTKENAVTLNVVYGDNSGSCTLKWQGASSLANDKKNFTIKFDTALTVVEGWGAQKKYCLKANFIDHSHARNVVSAKLWGTLVASRNHINATMAASPNYGAVDGFPCAIVLNGTFQGLYTWNIPKDSWMANMGSGTNEAILCASNSTDATAFKALPTYNGTSDLEIEYITDETDTGWLTTSANRLVSAVMNSYGADLDTTIAQYLDWESAIDYYLFTAFHAGKDNVTKNYLLLTYDGTKWYFGAYDMDGTYGIEWDGLDFERPNSTTSMTLEGMASAHRVFELIKRFKTDALKARWAELRTNFLSEGKICRTFENFVKDIPSRFYFEDTCRWPSIPSTSVSNVDQILRWVHQRLEYMDEMVVNLPEQETPVEPEQPVEVVNLVPTSVDTDGSIYNGTGYKDDTRLSSDGGVSGTAQAGSATTGFMAYTYSYPFIVRIKGALWLNQSAIDSTHWYFHIYDSSKTRKAGFSESASVSGYVNDVTATYDEATGVTTLDFTKCEDRTSSFATSLKAGGFIRLNARGKGSDLIVTVNQEIP